MYKKNTVIAACMVALLPLTACGKDEEEPAPQPTQAEQAEIQQEEAPRVVVSQESETPVEEETIVEEPAEDPQPVEREVDDSVNDFEQVTQLLEGYFASLEPASSSLTQSQADVFNRYAIQRGFNINDAERKELVDTAREVGMFSYYNEKSLNDKEIEQLIAMYLRLTYNKHLQGVTMTRSFNADDIYLETDKKMPTAELPSNKVKTSITGTVSGAEPEKPPYTAVKMGSKWYMSKSTIDPSDIYLLPNVSLIVK